MLMLLVANGNHARVVVLGILLITFMKGCSCQAFPILYLSIQIELLILLVASGMRAYVRAFEWRFWEFC